MSTAVRRRGVYACALLSAFAFVAAFACVDYRWESVVARDDIEAPPQRGPVVSFRLHDEIRAWRDRPNGGFPALDLAARPGLALAALSVVLVCTRFRRLAVAAAAGGAGCWVARPFANANHGFGPGYYAFLVALAALSIGAVLTQRVLGRKGKILGRVALGGVAVIALAAVAVPLFVAGPKDASIYPPRESSPYLLPFRGGLTRWCCQGNNGLFSHFDWQAYAYDFTMPAGSDVVAARGGIVELVLVENDGHGLGGNEIIVRHDGDGTIARYLHIMRGGSYVREGQRVAQGDLLAASGDVGNSTGPHLHFIVMRRNGKGPREGIPVTFADVPGDGIPREMRRYTSGNRRQRE